MKKMNFALAVCVLALALASCGGGSSSGGGTGGATNLTGTVYAPNGSDPVAGATIYIPSGSASISKGKTLFTSKTTGADGTTCPDPAEQSCGATCSGSDGSFTMDVTSCSSSSSTMNIVKGSLSKTVSLSCGSDSTCTLAAGETTFPSSGGDTPTMAVVTGQYDNIEDVLAKIGFGSLDADGHLDTSKTFNFTLIDGDGSLADTYYDWSTYLDGTNDMNAFDIIFINCGNNYDSATYLTDAAKTLISAFVVAGGKLYVTDLSYDFIDQVFPGFMQFEGDTTNPPTAGSINDAEDGKSGLAINASVGDTTMQDWLKNVTVIQAASGSGPGNPGTSADCNQSTFTTRSSSLNIDDSIPIGDFWGGWAEMIGKQSGTGAMDPTLWITGTVEEQIGGSTSRPLTASVTHGSNGGKLAYSSYHTAHSCPSLYFWPQERVLQYLILETF